MQPAPGARCNTTNITVSLRSEGVPSVGTAVVTCPEREASRPGQSQLRKATCQCNATKVRTLL